jgi:RNA recognition motif-containing protein
MLHCGIAPQERPPTLTIGQADHNFKGNGSGTPQRGRGYMRSRNHKGNVFVGNLPPDFSDERLAEAFDPFGMVLSAAIARDPNTGAKLRYGFVDIATEKAAKAAIAGLDGSKLDGSKLSVQMSEKPVKKAPGAGGPLKRPRPAAAPMRMAPRDADASPVFPAAPRPQPSFQVERRPLRPLVRRLTPT